MDIQFKLSRLAHACEIRNWKRNWFGSFTFIREKHRRTFKDFRIIHYIFKICEAYTTKSNDKGSLSNLVKFKNKPMTLYDVAFQNTGLYSNVKHSFIKQVNKEFRLKIPMIIKGRRKLVVRNVYTQNITKTGAVYTSISRKK